MENKIQKVSIVGFGNVSSHLIEAFDNIGIKVTHVFIRDLNNKSAFNIEFVSNYANLPKGQLTIVCVPDNEISLVVQQIDIKTPIAYTSGSVNLSDLDARQEIGVFYPLQTFTKGVPVDLSNVPFFIESESQSFGNKLFNLAKELSSNVKFANSEQRAKLHLSAVWVNNFTNHINFIAKDYLDSQELDFDDLIPLLQETIKKIERISPFASQTGPARRGDSKTIEQHLKMLPDDKKKIYKEISDSIIKTYSKND